MGTDEREADFTDYVRARQLHFVRFAYLLTGDPHSAEDLVQSAFAKVYRKWDSIHGSPDAYVRQTMINEHNSWWRRTWRHKEVTGSDLVTYADPPAPADRYADDDLRAHIRNLPRSSGLRSSCATTRTSPRPRPPQSSASPSAPSRATRAAR